ncbi:MAG: nicotinate-nucleotide diphosphorylase (carboxylating), partial [bacterium]|nr:nicotinate-nucleotide diphosphorylase (carboxylating) [bacterium]
MNSHNKEFEAELTVKIIELALLEDRVREDVTTNSLLDCDNKVIAVVTAKEEGVVSGTGVFKAVFETVDPQVSLDIRVADGCSVKKGDVVIRIEGMESSILKAERTALNFMQRLSGIASLTRRFTDKLKPHDVSLLDTRKTTPGMRYLEKKAVLDGGGSNHRLNLEDMAMV